MTSNENNCRGKKTIFFNEPRTDERTTLLRVGVNTTAFVFFISRSGLIQNIFEVIKKKKITVKGQ